MLWGPIAFQGRSGCLKHLRNIALEHTGQPDHGAQGQILLTSLDPGYLFLAHAALFGQLNLCKAMSLSSTSDAFAKSLLQLNQRILFVGSIGRFAHANRPRVAA
jgi:hypothetical protein